MPKKKPCIEPKIGKRIREYNKDACFLLNEGKKKLTVEELYVLEAHLIWCPFCRSKLTLRGRLEFEFKLISTGLFLDDPVQFWERKQALGRFLRGKMSLEDFESKLKVSDEERRKVKAFMRGD